MIITPYKVTNPLYAYTNTTTAKRTTLIPTTEILRVPQNKNLRKGILNLL